jgi:hypothetical protein
MSQFNERFEEKAMKSSNLEVGKLYKIKCKNYNEVLDAYRGRDFLPHNTPNEVVYGRVVRKFGGSIKPHDEIKEELMSILTGRYMEPQRTNALWSFLTETFIIPYYKLAYYQFEIVEGIPFPNDGMFDMFDCFTGYWINTKCYLKDYTFHEEIFHTAGMFKNAAVKEDDDEDD